MSFHGVRRIVSELALPDGRVEATLELHCGCTIARRLDENRLLTAEDGARLAVGKYPCPRGHPVAGPRD
ncbi:MAG: hypothetical protein SFW67_22905 [Myxococcaceae bacterium]|nr:hypothetical protein [Myxococcaceae bacterium]